MPSTDWNIRLVNARQAQRMLPRKPDTDDEIDWRGVEIALVDTGYHPSRVRAVGRRQQSGAAGRSR